MSIISSLTNDILTIINDSGYTLDELVLKPSSRRDLGQFQINDAMKLASIYKKNPITIANDIVNNLKLDNRFTNVNIAGPGFINISLTDDYLISIINDIVNDINCNIDKYEKKKVIIDYGGANVAKALHVGHLRSANIGESLKRLARLLGYEVLGDAHLGDYGRPLGLVILEIKNMYPNLEYFNPNYVGDYKDIKLPITNKDLEIIYPSASIKAKEDNDYLEKARIITKKIQSHQKGYYELWQRIVDISKNEIKKSYCELNVNFDLWLGESDAVEYLDELIRIYKGNNLLVDSYGAKIINVKEDSDTYDIPPLLFIKSNSSISYETTDLATILQRMKEYNPDEIWYVVDARQDLHFKQVFRAARKGKIVNNETKLDFIGFGTMNGKDGKPFKTRDGGIMTLNNLIEIVKEEISKRMNMAIISSNEKNDIAKKIAIATIKYADLLPFRGTDYIFELEKFADLEGKTGPYLLYSTIRMKSLLSNAHSANIAYNEIKVFSSEKERDIALLILNMPNVLKNSMESKSLNEIAEYIYQLTSLYNNFYANNKILIEKDVKKRESWLILTKLVYDINMILLDILGIEVPDKM